MDTLAKTSLIIALEGLASALAKTMPHIKNETLRNTMTTLQAAVTGALTAVISA